jgi:hypothetical protein
MSRKSGRRVDSSRIPSQAPLLCTQDTHAAPSFCRCERRLHSPHVDGLLAASGPNGRQPHAGYIVMQDAGSVRSSSGDTMLYVASRLCVSVPLERARCETVSRVLDAVGALRSANQRREIYTDNVAHPPTKNPVGLPKLSAGGNWFDPGLPVHAMPAAFWETHCQLLPVLTCVCA